MHKGRVDCGGVNLCLNAWNASFLFLYDLYYDNRVQMYRFSSLHRDFEEDSACDWMEEVEKMFSEH